MQKTRILVRSSLILIFQMQVENSGCILIFFYEQLSAKTLMKEFKSVVWSYVDLSNGEKYT